MSAQLSALALETDLFIPSTAVVSPRYPSSHVVATVAEGITSEATSLTHIPPGAAWRCSVDSPVPITISDCHCDMDCEGGSLALTSPGLSVLLDRSASTSDDEEAEIVPEFRRPQLFFFMNFLSHNTSLLERLLKSSRRSAYISKHADIRFVALHIMFRFVEASGVGTFPGGTRAQGVLVGACLSLAAKYCDQVAYLPAIIHETGLDRTATVTVADVVEKEVEVLSAIGFHITIPTYWDSIVRVALATPVTVETVAQDRRKQARTITKRDQQRIYYAATFTDRMLYYIARHPQINDTINELRTDEVGFGASIAVAAGLSSAFESVSVIFTPFALGESDAVGLTLPGDVANGFARCVDNLARHFREALLPGKV